MTACIHTGTFILRCFAPNFGRLIAEEQRLEGHFRYAHSRVIQNAEEIAFYNGANAEKAVLGTLCVNYNSRNLSRRGLQRSDSTDQQTPFD